MMDKTSYLVVTTLSATLIVLCGGFDMLLIICNIANPTLFKTLMTTLITLLLILCVYLLKLLIDEQRRSNF